MANFTLDAQSRAEDKQGKGSSRRLRLESLVPAIIYGGEAEPVAVTIELRQLVKALEDNAFFEEVIAIKVGDKVENVKIQALQRHPAKNTPMHADFKRA
ncbi:LSU ribosomal protein L25P [Acinetobacter calcoaceticus]|uniref:Large ribosomal subunit protein bL25 n=1 Tax=Acinetobacter calcoaceticus TaxID=471 RepID=A0A4R1Y4C9_ACICA|nr:LSU ribosomal protein L25P [Acinetobacter calcoaceticus]